MGSQAGNATHNHELHAAAGRRILLCVSGLTPQVVTETVFALAAGRQWVPDEVHVVTTTEGAQRARLLLLSEQPGWFRRLCKDQGLPSIHFEPEGVHVLQSADGQPLEDVRTAQDNIAAADAIINLVRRFTAIDGSELHVSLAGGRKTLGFFAGYALSLLGRDQDRLSHVLVSEPFEGSPDFFYPTPYERVIEVGPIDRRRPVDCRDARVTLADIPFVRLRHGIDRRLLEGRIGFADAVESAQPTFAPPHVRIEVDAGRLFAGGRRVPMAPALVAFYLWLGRRAQRGLPGVERPAVEVGNVDYAADYLAAYDLIKGRSVRTERRFRDGMLATDFDVMKTKANKALENALGPAATHYQIAGEGKPQRFALRLPPGAIEITGET